MTRRQLLTRAATVLGFGIVGCKMPRTTVLKATRAVTYTFPAPRPATWFLLTKFNEHMRGKSMAFMPVDILASAELFDAFSNEIPVMTRSGEQPHGLPMSLHRGPSDPAGWWVAFNLFYPSQAQTKFMTSGPRKVNL